MAKKAFFGEVGDGEGETGVRSNLEKVSNELALPVKAEVTEDKPVDAPGPKIKEKDNIQKELPQYNQEAAIQKLHEIYDFIQPKKEDDVVRDHGIHRQHYYAINELVKQRSRGDKPTLSDGSCEMLHNIHAKLKAKNLV